MTLDCRHLIPVFISRLLKFIVERTISYHSSAVSFSESAEHMTDLATRDLVPTALRSFAPCSGIPSPSAILYDGCCKQAWLLKKSSFFSKRQNLRDRKCLEK